jgi:hypothetical protein
MCEKDFLFSTKSQKSYSMNKWKYPVRCRGCHEEFKKKASEEKNTVEEEVEENTVEEKKAEEKVENTVEKKEEQNTVEE